MTIGVLVENNTPDPISVQASFVITYSGGVIGPITRPPEGPLTVGPGGISPITFDATPPIADTYSVTATITGGQSVTGSFTVSPVGGPLTAVARRQLYQQRNRFGVRH